MGRASEPPTGSTLFVLLRAPADPQAWKAFVERYGPLIHGWCLQRHLQEADAEDTFCAVVPEKHALTLAGGVYTGNCGACEPECPVEAIFPEDALPDKWQPFVRINYAYPDPDPINTLVDDYAREHDVHNPPLETR